MNWLNISIKYLLNPKFVYRLSHKYDEGSCRGRFAKETTPEREPGLGLCQLKRVQELFYWWSVTLLNATNFRSNFSDFGLDGLLIQGEQVAVAHQPAAIDHSVANVVGRNRIDQMRVEVIAGGEIGRVKTESPELCHEDFNKCRVTIALN